MVMETPAVKKGITEILFGENFISLLVLSAVLIFGGVYFAYFKSEIEKLRPGGALDVSSVKREAEIRGEALGKLKMGTSALSSVSKIDREKIDVFLPQTADEPAILVALSTIARESGMALLTADVSAGSQLKGDYPDGLKTVVITLGMGGGDYGRLKLFLQNVERNLRIMDVESLAFAPTSAAYSLRIKAYFLGKQ